MTTRTEYTNAFGVVVALRGECDGVVFTKRLSAITDPATYREEAAGVIDGTISLAQRAIGSWIGRWALTREGGSFLLSDWATGTDYRLPVEHTDLDRLAAHWEGFVKGARS